MKFDKRALSACGESIESKGLMGINGMHLAKLFDIATSYRGARLPWRTNGASDRIVAKWVKLGAGKTCMMPRSARNCQYDIFTYG